MAVVSAPLEPLLSNSVSTPPDSDPEHDAAIRRPIFPKEIMRKQKDSRHDPPTRITV
jgi:hypothetical protein